MKEKFIEQFIKTKKYFLYASSIVFSRGLEYFILFLAPLMLTKQEYGDFEFYKRIIEFSSTIMVFGLPTLMLTYSKSVQSKDYLLVFSLFIIGIIAIFSIPFLYVLDYLFLLIPLLFYSFFFSNGIFQVYFLVSKGSNTASLFKIIVSCTFYLAVLLLILYSDQPVFAFVESAYYLLPIGMILIIWLIKSLNFKLHVFLKYFKLFKKLLISSSTLVVSTMASMMFMYTDVFILKFLSSSPSLEIANFSFILNITNMIVIVPMTLIQVDIEKIKGASEGWLQGYRKKTLLYILLFAMVVTMCYVVLINSYYAAFSDTLILFAILIVGKIIQSHSVFLGTQILIKKYFAANLKINLVTVTFNIITSYFCYLKFGLTGLAFMSTFSLALRYFMLRYFYRKSFLKT